MKVPMLDLRPQYQSLKETIMPALSELADSQMFILGPRVEQLEKELAAYCHTPYSVGVSSGSDALLVALMIENLKPGDEVITSTFTFFATVGAIVRAGAKPVFADIDPVTFNIDPADVAKKITRKTKGIIPVHLFGQAADMDPIMKLAKEHKLFVIEDGCQAIGAEYRNRRVGSIGDYGAFSFFPSKNLGCFGDGGAVSCTDEKRYNLLKVFRNHGQSKTYFHEYVGGNFRLDALQAVVLSAKLKELDNWSAARQKNAAEYEKLFADLEREGYITTPGKAAYPVRHIYNQYCIRVHNGKRDELKQFLASKEVGCAIYYPLSLHLQPCFRELGGKAGDCPESELATSEVLALPIYPESTPEMRQYVCDCMGEFFRK